MLRPLADRIVVRPAEAEKQTASGLYLPDQDRPQQGHVLATGPDVDDIDVGDVVVYSRLGEIEINADGETLLILGIRDVFAVVE